MSGPWWGKPRRIVLAELFQTILAVRSSGCLGVPRGRNRGRRITRICSGGSPAAKAGRPVDANQRFVRIGKGELVHAPRLALRGALSDKFIPEFGGKGVHVFQVKIEAERVFSGHEPTFHPLRPMK